MVVTALWPGSRTKTDSAGKEVRIATTSSKSGPERERGAGPGYHHHTRTGGTGPGGDTNRNVCSAGDG